MNTLEKVLLYFMHTHTDVEGELWVGRNDIAAIVGCTVVTAAKYIAPLVKEGYVLGVKKPLARGHGYKYLYRITHEGVNLCHAIWQEVNELYWEHRQLRLESVIKKASKVDFGKKKPSKISPKQKVLL